MNNDQNKTVFTAVGVLLGVGVGYALIKAEKSLDNDAFIALLITFGIFAGLIAAALIGYVVYIKFKFREANRVYKQYGPSEQYLAVLGSTLKKPTYIQQLIMADLCLMLHRFDECERILEHSPGELVLRGKEKAMYYKTYLALFIMTGRYRQASDLFVGCKEYLDRYFSTFKQIAPAYYDDAAVICAIRHDFASADNYRLLSETAVSGRADGAYIPLLIKAKLFILDGQQQNAQTAINEVEAVINRTPFKYPWQRELALYTLQDGVSCCSRIRSDLMNMT